MTYFADLTPYTYGGDCSVVEVARRWPGVSLVNVGWLARGRRYRRGVAPAGLAVALRRMAVTHRAQQSRGRHPCPFCASLVFGRRKGGPEGSAEIWVRGGEGVAYAAPELIAHYVEAHGYVPPGAFVEAVFDAVGTVRGVGGF
ncbi:hypothetical protein GCM10017562_73090 [Streptomyces roseofulvus]|uniref:DUF7919 family protein n=1 Tax=Streptomyces roseofulvus TaxID=33902 RepID=UPI00337C17C8